MTELQKGKVKFYDSNKGYGFIYPEGGGKDVFVHRNELERAGYKDLNVGDSVSYELGANHKNKQQQAVNIKII